MKNFKTELIITNYNGVYVTDSRDVAKMLGKQHDQMMRSIRTHIEHLVSAKMQTADFFIPSNYRDANSQLRPCYFISKKGCDLLANKTIGKKGTLFTATYVTKFEEMEKALVQPQVTSIEELIILQAKSVIELKAKVEKQDEQLTTLNHRMDNMDSLDTIGDLKQRLNKMVQRFAHQNSVAIPYAWKAFVQTFNTAYRTNLNRLKSEYMRSHGLRSITTPIYLEAVERLEDGIRVADKMLNQLAT